MNRLIAYAAASAVSAAATYIAYTRVGPLMGLFGAALTKVLVWAAVEKARYMSYGR